MHFKICKIYIKIIQPNAFTSLQRLILKKVITSFQL